MGSVWCFRPACRAAERSEAPQAYAPLEGVSCSCVQQRASNTGQPLTRGGARCREHSHCRAVRCASDGTCSKWRKQRGPRRRSADHCLVAGEQEGPANCCLCEATGDAADCAQHAMRGSRGHRRADAASRGHCLCNVAQRCEAIRRQSCRTGGQARHRRQRARHAKHRPSECRQSWLRRRRRSGGVRVLGRRALIAGRSSRRATLPSVAHRAVFMRAGVLSPFMIITGRGRAGTDENVSYGARTF